MTSRISKSARKSVVIVADKNDENAYCSGCVMIKDSSVMVIAPAAFVEYRQRQRHLKVVFSDRHELDATVVSVKYPFCVLKTAFHPGCEAIRLWDEDVDGLIPTSTFMFTPISQTVNQRMSTFSTVESLTSYRANPADLVPNSTNYFLVNCPYFETTRCGVNRVTAAPVYTLNGKTAGIVVQNCRDENIEPGAAAIKVVWKARHVHELMPPKKPGKKRKRGQE